jgi:hypothetical protein
MPVKSKSPRRAIATFMEGPLHASLKIWYEQPGDRIEVPLDGRQIDIIRGDLLIEIQTSSFSAIKNKLEALLEEHPVRLVYPLATEKWILRIEGEGGRILGRRKSPKRGKIQGAFEELVSLSKLFQHPNFSFEILLTQQEEVRRHEAGRVWRRKGWVIVERRLLHVIESRVFRNATDLQQLLPAGLPLQFTTADLAGQADIPRKLAQKMAYSLREAGAISKVGKKRNALLYETA